MIRLRVEWRHTCPDCGTCVVVDFMADPNGFRICPWCGRITNNGRGPSDRQLRERVSHDVLKLEKHANSSLLPS